MPLPSSPHPAHLQSQSETVSMEKHSAGEQAAAYGRPPSPSITSQVSRVSQHTGFAGSLGEGTAGDVPVVAQGSHIAC